jgi:hypothetical protein
MLAVAVLLAGNFCLPAFAQTTQPFGMPPIQASPVPPHRMATTLEPVDQSLTALLDGGYKVVAATDALFTLEKSGKFVLCRLWPTGSMAAAEGSTSECHRLN